MNILSRSASPPSIQAGARGAVPLGGDALSLDDRLRDFEASLIAWALRVANGNRSRAAALLHIRRSTLGDRIQRCGLAGPESAPGGSDDAGVVAASA